MEKTGLPAPFARRAMMLMPPPVLRHGIRILMRRMERRHPRLFDNLARMEAATIRIEPLDLPHRFLLSLGTDHPTLQWLDGADAQAPATAMVKGKLQALLDLLEGLAVPTSGSFRLFGRAPTPYPRSRVGVVMQKEVQLQRCTAAEYADLFERGEFGGPFHAAPAVPTYPKHAEAVRRFLRIHI
jgi:hypothetical protein